MTAYEVYQYTSESLNNITAFRDAIKKKQVVEDNLPLTIRAKLTPEYEKQMVEAQRRALLQIAIELNPWYE
jgi:hypothetical protein